MKADLWIGRSPLVQGLDENETTIDIYKRLWQFDDRQLRGWGKKFAAKIWLQNGSSSELFVF